MAATAPCACWGLLRRREAWTLTWRGRFVLLLLAVAGAAGVLLGIEPFLAVTRPVNGEFLVVEGWIPDYATVEAVAEFRRHPYQRLLTCGGLVRSGYNLDPEDTYAHMSADHYRRLGLTNDQVVAVPAQLGDRDRTYNSAVALRKWFQQNAIPVRALNVVTLGPHARRTRLMYEKAFGGKVAVGIISVADHEYDPRHWWRYSEGVKEVFSEGMAYLYARLWFRAPS